MGYYIETDGRYGKAEYIIENHGGVATTYGEAAATFDGIGNVAVIVVVSNGGFEAAGFAYDRREFDYMTRYEDNRPKRYVLMPLDAAKKLTGFKERKT